MAFFLMLAVIGFFVFLFFIHDMPDLDNLETKGRRASIIFESYDGKIIATYGDLFKDIVNADELPPHISQAVIAIEDHRFYEHNGVDALGILRAIYTNILNRRIVQGGSSLTQQLAKNLFLSPNKSIKRKVQEVILAIWLERKFTKKQILSIYLNRVYFGACAYGIDAAALRYFGKKARQLSLYEAAKLAGVLKAPSTYSPFYNPAKSDQRAELVLQCMVDAKYINEDEMKEAILQKDKLGKVRVPIDENRYFTDWAMEQIQDIIGSEYEDIIVRTTLDTTLQKNAICIIKNIISEHGFRNKATQMALVAIDKTGAVRAMVGGHSYGASQYNRVLAVRSFGSAFKYFVYLAALEKGIDICDHVLDTPLSIGSWSPKNYGYKSNGSITLQEAFVKSVNTSAVRIAQKVGMDYIVEKSEQLGITTEISKNLASALGASGTTLLDITACYGATMTGGLKVIPFSIMSIRTTKGKILYRVQQAKKIVVMSQSTCEKMKTIMQAQLQRGTGRNANISTLKCYGKTGTSNDCRDASFIGFINPIAVGIWVGNDDNTPMSPKVTGGFLPAMVWREFMMTAFGYKKISYGENGDYSVGRETKPVPNAGGEIKSVPKKRRRLKEILDGL
jgi:penicillin-binding protein 1A